MARDFEDYFRRLIPKGRGLDILKQDPELPDAKVTSEYMIDNVWIVGDPDHVTFKLRELSRSLGGFGVLLAMGHEWHPEAEWKASMQLLAEEVMPNLVDL